MGVVAAGSEMEAGGGAIAEVDNVVLSVREEPVAEAFVSEEGV